MTIEEVLAQVDELKPNQYSDTVKVSWLSKLDQKIWYEVIQRYEKVEKEDEDAGIDTEDDGDNVPDLPDVPEHNWSNYGDANLDTFNGYTVNDTGETLIVDDAYADLYIDYVFAMIDYNNQELDRYANSMMMFNSKYADFKNFYNRTHTIISSQIKVW